MVVPQTFPKWNNPKCKKNVSWLFSGYVIYFKQFMAEKLLKWEKLILIDKITHFSRSRSFYITLEQIVFSMSSVMPEAPVPTQCVMWCTEFLRPSTHCRRTSFVGPQTAGSWQKNFLISGAFPPLLVAWMAPMWRSHHQKRMKFPTWTDTMNTHWMCLLSAGLTSQSSTWMQTIQGPML